MLTVYTKLAHTIQVRFAISLKLRARTTNDIVIDVLSLVGDRSRAAINTRTRTSITSYKYKRQKQCIILGGILKKVAQQPAERRAPKKVLF